LLADALGDGALEVRFAANVDPRDLERALEGAEPKTTLSSSPRRPSPRRKRCRTRQRQKNGERRFFYAVTSKRRGGEAIRRK